jgi:hypothetical protein
MAKIGDRGSLLVIAIKRHIRLYTPADIYPSTHWGQSQDTPRPNEDTPNFSG